MTRDSSALSIGQLVSLACTLEVSAPKPGNVHRSSDFDDLCFQDFIDSAIAIGPVFDNASSLTLGELVLQAIQATQRLIATNTNLGLVLLMAPIAKAASFENLSDGIGSVLANLTADDAQKVYKAINLAQSSALGTADDMDVSADSPADLLLAMRHAQDRDMIAKQYVTGYADLFTKIVPRLELELSNHDESEAIVRTHVWCMSAFPDSLIARKRGADAAEASRKLAEQAVRASDDSEYWRLVSDLDFWLRCDGHARNPGTTADLIGAAILIALLASRS
ncbi:MAG: triphosphoribosyl-dephospho-CoA synthase [Pirellulaceae bacterium]